MFQEVGNAGKTGALVLAAHMIPDLIRDGGGGMVLYGKNRQTVIENVLSHLEEDLSPGAGEEKYREKNGEEKLRAHRFSYGAGSEHR